MSCITWSFLPVIMWVYKDKKIVEIPTFARNENVFRAISALVLVMQVACCILCSVKLFHPRIPRISLDINAACVRFSWKRFLFYTRAIVDLKEVRGRGLEWIPKVLKETILTPISKWEIVNIECSFSVLSFFSSQAFIYLFIFFTFFLLISWSIVCSKLSAEFHPEGVSWCCHPELLLLVHDQAKL